MAETQGQEARFTLDLGGEGPAEGPGGGAAEEARPGEAAGDVRQEH